MFSARVLVSCGVKIILTVFVVGSLLTGCVVVERPYHWHHDDGPFYHDHNHRHCD